ncbi:pyridoxal phosphate-dependent decarboxylase family protein [Pseudochryseolinea flava]|uniref:Aspartate aminotransferase family protein n=1 Tax=Pseudochryseolinea flava TaxID=2059302 RepID=A0A364XYB1_9BACT|nr:pyridoxal-dependent decarboxylase [Pseudochryseolinea flava]RAV99426.1 aspartate aminotransferase family protein [Pseudochryseolinea flava]
MSYLNTTLHHDFQQLDTILQKSLRLANEYFSNQTEMAPGRYIPDVMLNDMPRIGIGASAVLDLFANYYAEQMANSAGPRYFGFVTGGSTPASIAGDWLVSAYDQNACGSNDSIAPQMERQTLHFLKQLLGIDEEYFGSFVTGATMSNFVGLAIGRQWVGEQFGIDFSQDGISDKAPIKVVSATPHSSIFKAMSMLGIGRKSMIHVPTMDGREAIDVNALEDVLKEINHPVIVVANAGTVNTVDFDNMIAIGKLKKKYNFWLHVDGAFGAFAACSDKYDHLMNGVNHADSITVDAHKWLNVPYDAAMQFTRHQALQLKVFQNSAAYLGDPLASPDYFHYTPENSRRFRALPAWFTLLAYGWEGYREMIERNCDAAKLLADALEASSNRFQLLAPVRMNVVCFTLTGVITMDEIKTFLAAIRDDGRVFFTPTMYKGKPGIRAAISNWKTQPEDIAIAVTALNQVHQAILHTT